MQVFESQAQFAAWHDKGCVATIGKYDGMHLGHQKLLHILKDEAQRLALPSLVVLSEPHPEEFFAGDQAPPRLQPFEEKKAFLEDFGIDAVLCLRFDETLRQMSAEDFVQELLIDNLRVCSLIVGYDFTFGHNRRGNVDMLRAYGEECGFSVHEVDGEFIEGQRISSTQVREHLMAGECDRVQELLGRPYSMGGWVVQGRQLGRELGFPTANIGLDGLRPPLTGVYCVTASVAGEDHPGVANIGYRPTVDDEQAAHLEVHLLDYSGTLYGEYMRVHFLQQLRPEEKFSDLDALKAQVEQDIATAREWFRSHPARET